MNTTQVEVEVNNYEISLLGLRETRWIVRTSESINRSNNSVLRPWGRASSLLTLYTHTERVALMLTNESQRALIS